MFAVLGQLDAATATQSAEEGSVPTQEAANLGPGGSTRPREATAKATLIRAFSEVAALLDSSRAVSHSGTPGLDTGEDWSRLEQDWVRLAASLEGLTSAELKPTQALQSAAFLDRARFEILRCEATPWGTNPGWFARRAVERIRSIPPLPATGPEAEEAIDLYVARINSLPELLGSARRSILRARAVDVADATVASAEAQRWLAEKLPNRFAQAGLTQTQREELTEAVWKALSANLEFQAWLADPDSLLPRESTLLPAAAWLAWFRAATGSSASLNQIERTLLEQLRRTSRVEEERISEPRSLAAQTDLVREAVEQAIALVAPAAMKNEQGQSTLEVRMDLVSDPLEVEPVRFRNEPNLLVVEWLLAPAAADATRTARLSDPTDVAARAAGFFLASQAIPDASSDPLGFRALELAWPTFAPPATGADREALEDAHERRFRMECAVLVAALRRHARRADRREAAGAFDYLGGLPERTAKEFLDRIELEPEFGMAAWIALQWRSLTPAEQAGPQLRDALIQVSGLRPEHLNLKTTDRSGR